MALTSKQEAFAQAIADGLNQSDAYRKAYDAEGMKPETVQNSAYKLMQNGEVTARVDELRSQLEEKALWTREMSVKALQRIVQGSDKGGEVVAAVKELNAMHGYIAPTKSETKVSGGFRVENVIVDTSAR